MREAGGDFEHVAWVVVVFDEPLVAVEFPFRGFLRAHIFGFFAGERGLAACGGRAISAVRARGARRNGGVGAEGGVFVCLG